MGDSTKFGFDPITSNTMNQNRGIYLLNYYFTMIKQLMYYHVGESKVSIMRLMHALIGFLRIDFLYHQVTCQTIDMFLLFPVKYLIIYIFKSTRVFKSK